MTEDASPNGVPRCASRGGILASVLDVLSVGGDDERRPRRECPEKARRDEEVRVDDVRSELPRDAQRVEREREVATSPAGAAVDDGALQVVAPRGEFELEVGHEHPEIGIVGPGYICETRRIRML